MSDRDRARLERHGRAIRSAYRSAQLTSSQHDRHRARLADRYVQTSGRWTRRVGAVAATALLLLLVVTSFAVWSDLAPASDNQEDDAVATLLPMRTDTPRESAVPTVTDEPSDPTASPLRIETAFGFDTSTGTCLTTPVSTGVPGDEEQAAFTDTWYGSDPEEGLWAGLGWEHEGVWTTTNRVLWWRQRPLPIEVAGHRLDGDARPLVADLSDEDNGRLRQFSLLNFAEPGCWEIEASAGDEMNLRIVVEVVPYEESQAGTLIHQAMREEVIEERLATIPFAIPDTCPASNWTGPESRIRNWYPTAVIGDDDWQYSYYLDGENLSLNSRLGVLFEGPNTLAWITEINEVPSDWTFNATFVDSPGQFGLVGMENGAFESAEVADPRNPGSSLKLFGHTFSFDYPGCWVLSVQSEEVSFNHYVYVYPRVDRETVRGHDRLYVVEDDGRVWGWDLEVEAKNLFQISTGDRVDAALSPDGERLYLVGIDSLTAHDALTGEELWRAPIGEHRRFWQEAYGPPNIATSSDGERIFVVSVERQNLPWIQIFDASDGSKLGDSEIVHGNCPANMHTSPDGRTLYLVCITTDEGVKVIDIESGEPSNLIEEQFSSSAVSPDGRLLYAVTTSQHLITIDMDSREIVLEFDLDLAAPPEMFLQMAEVAPDGSRLYIGLGRESSERGAPWEDVREIATIDLTDGSTLDVYEAGFFIDGGGLEVDSDGKLFVNSAGRIMRLEGDEAEALRFFVEMDARQFLIASPDG